MSLLADHNYHRLSLGTTRGVRAWTKENSPTRFEGMQNGNSQDGEQSGSALNPQTELILDLEMPLLGLICRHKSSLEETLASHPSCSVCNNQDVEAIKMGTVRATDKRKCLIYLLTQGSVTQASR